MPTDPPETTILVVDDDSAIRGSMQMLLEGPGRRVLIAESGVDGLATLEREAVDLVVSDLDMPKMDGIAFLKAAHRLRPGMRCLLMSARVTPRAEAAVRQGVAEACVAKGGDPQPLLDAVERALGERD